MDPSENKLVNLAKMFNSQADKIGFKLGEKLPGRIEAFLNFLVRKGGLGANFEEVIPGTHVAIGKIIEFVGNVGEVPKDTIKKFVPGILGDMLYEAVNEAIDAAGRGAGDNPKAGTKPADDTSPAAPKDDPGQMKGFVIGGQLHKSNCTTAARPRAFKGEKTPEDITVIDAIKRRHALSYCGCWGLPQEVDQLTAQVQASLAPAPPVEAKVETKAETPASKPEPKPGSGKLFDLLMRLKQEEPFLFSSVVERVYRPMTGKDLDLKKKFFLAFHNNGSYDELKELLREPCEFWDEWLDDYIGQPTPEKSWLARESKETEEMILAIIEQLEKVPPVLNTLANAAKKSGERAKDARLDRMQQRENASRRNRYIMIGVMLIVGIAALFNGAL